NQVTTMMTTHFSRLKALAMITPGFENASVGGKSAVKPDFKLVSGLPGTSEGITVAERLGLSSSVTLRARELLGEGDNKIDSLLSELFAMKKEILDQRQDLQTRVKAVEEENQRLSQLRGEKERELRKLRKEGYERTMEEVVRVRRLVSHLEAKAKEDNITPLRRRELKQAVQKVSDRITEKMQEFHGPPVSEQELVPGCRVRSRSFGQIVEVVERTEDGKVLVVLGNFKSWLDREDLEALETQPQKTERKDRPSTIKIPPPPLPEEDPVARLENIILTATNTLDVRGKRVEQAISELDRHLDSMILKGEPACAVIHGFGTGALRATIRDYVKDSPFVRLFRPGKKGEGGDGVTVILIV
ncbi:Smr/MutS family protein, partial [Myxococcota bacterium]|nr:Smr/MutS family protein [Myxococcota bacterium]